MDLAQVEQVATGVCHEIDLVGAVLEVVEAVIHQPVDGLGSTVEEHAVGGGVERGGGHVVAFEGEFEGDRLLGLRHPRASGPSPTP